MLCLSTGVDVAGAAHALRLVVAALLPEPLCALTERLTLRDTDVFQERIIQATPVTEGSTLTAALNPQAHGGEPPNGRTS
jgi:hypothetical protein